MNKKYIMKNALGKDVYCIISGDADPEKAINGIFGFTEGQGYAARLKGNEIDIVDYFHGDTVGSFEIKRVEDTDEAPTDRFIEF